MNLDRFDLLAVTALVLTFGLLAAGPVGPKALGDLEFHKHAKRMALAVKGNGPLSEVEFRKAPGPILFYFTPYLAVPVNASDQSYWRAGVVWTAAWMAVALLLLRRTARRLGGERAGKAAVFLSLLTPFSVYYSLGIAAEGPAYISTAVFLYGWVRHPEQGSRLLMVTGLLFLILCRPNAALIPVFGLAAGLRLWRSYPDAARLATSVAVGTVLMFVAAGLLLSLLHGGPAQSRQAGYFWDTTLQGRFQFRTEPWDWRFWDSAKRAGSEDFAAFAATNDRIRREAAEQGVPVQTAMRDWVIRDTLTHPFLTARMALVRILALHLSFVNSKPPGAFAVWIVPGHLVYWTFHFFVNLIGLSISVLALSFLWSRRFALARNWPLWAPWAALILFHSLVYAEPRYLLPARYCQLVMAACALTALLPEPIKHPAAAVEAA